jgi:hypothetical protein
MSNAFVGQAHELHGFQRFGYQTGPRSIALALAVARITGIQATEADVLVPTTNAVRG